jgi:hypothetical protein
MPPELLDPLVLNAAAAGISAAAMVMLGRRYSLLERPPSARRCAACGRWIRRRSRCSCSE